MWCNNNQERSNGDQEDKHSSKSEDFDEELKCCVCLDLVYKPVVLGCGHTSCFWCIYKTMGGISKSYCPVCRYPYDHFPRICKMLHFLILKLYPLPFKRRESQVAGEEQKMRMFSPQFNDHLWNLHSGNELLNLKIVLCALCNRLLYRPVVLNCGHVYCEECIIDPNYQSCTCLVCKCLHPNGFPNKCFVLEHMIEHHLPKEFAKRKLSALGSINRQCDLSASTEVQKHKVEVPTLYITGNVCFPAWVIGDGPVVHYGFGCDHCGIFPVTGNRYHCRDCKGISGFDLCEQCYRNSLNLPGRFNQPHSSEHKFNKIGGAKISFVRVLQINENAPHIITPYISEECLANPEEDSKQHCSTGPDDENRRSSKGSSDNEPKRMSSEGPSDYQSSGRSS